MAEPKTPGTALARKPNTPGGGVAIEPSIVARVARGLRYIATGKRDDFFGPGDALEPAAQGVADGRAFDFPFAYNTSVSPRAYEAIDFPTLRLLADNLDVLRLAIETRKDQMSKLGWGIRKKGESGDEDDMDATATKIRDFLLEPDGEHDFADWKRAIYEDLLVLDAPCVYIRRTRGGDPLTLEAIDGATIARKLDARGRTPRPPLPGETFDPKVHTAYQQIIKGLPAVDYSADEIVYKPRNIRSFKVYGFSPVEQIVMTINVAIRRQVHQLNAYTVGNIPPGLLSVPDDWSPSQIREFQTFWDQVRAGDLVAKQQLQFVPGGMKYERLLTDPLFDSGDEWLARIICYAYSLPPNAFVKQMNRATATSAQEVALEEGLAPLMEWDKRFMDRLIRLAFRTNDYEFFWTDTKDVDPEVQATIDDKYIRAGVRSAEDVAADHGWKAPPKPEISAPGEPAINGAAGTVAPPASGAASADGAAKAKEQADAKAEKLEGAIEEISRVLVTLAALEKRAPDPADALASRARAYASLVERGVPPNGAAKLCGLDVSLGDAGDVAFVSASLIPLAEAGAPTPAPEPAIAKRAPTREPRPVVVAPVVAAAPSVEVHPTFHVTIEAPAPGETVRKISMTNARGETVDATISDVPIPPKE